jgi:uncharacterized protein YchJ
MDLCSVGVAVSMRQTMDIHWFLFSESPTNASRLLRSRWSSVTASNLHCMRAINHPSAPEHKTCQQLRSFRDVSS